MRKPLCLLITSAALAGVALAQQLSAEQVPVTVKDSLQSKFPGVSKVEWKLKFDKNYEAEFKRKGVEVAAIFDADGKWLETETAIEPSDLTAEVRTTIAKEYKGYKTIETQKVERADTNGILFEVHLENHEEILKLQLQRNGKISSKSAKRKKNP